MNLVYSPLAVRDLEEIAAYHRAVAAPHVATAIAQRIERIIDRLPLQPRSAPRVAGRRDVRAVLVLRYSYKIFYRQRGDTIEILHVRHTARQPWRERSAG
jgi:plasmid stabilization system protein ParE